MDDSAGDGNPLDPLAEEFAERLRRGERPALSEYTQRHPELAEQIRTLFPALVVMEQLGAVDAEPGDGRLSDTELSDTLAAGPGRRLGDYRILREIGRGGMGIVYEAIQESLGRQVALKVLPRPALAAATHHERFQREARAVARLHHTNIVPVFGVGDCDGVSYYAMQLIDGQGLDAAMDELRQQRRQTPVPAGAGASHYRTVAGIGIQVAEALAHAHARGVLHRDVKPSNLLLDRHGTVWVTDFGLARAEDADDLTGTGDLVGTIRYMAPERFHGQSLPAGDLYSLGITLYELLVLRPAYAGHDRPHLIAQAQQAQPIAPRRVDPGIPRDLETIVLKCLAKEPAARYADAGALAEDLRRFLADRPIHARRSSALERLGRSCRRNPLVASLAAVLLLVLTATAVGSSIAAWYLNEALDAAESSLGRAEQAERGGKHDLLQAYQSEARALRMSRRQGQRFDTLAVLRKAVALAQELELPPERYDALRTEAIACLALPDVQPGKAWGAAAAREGAFNADIAETSRRYAYGTATGQVSVRAVDDDTELFCLNGFGAGVGCWTRLSPDGTAVLASSVDGRLKVWRLDRPAATLLVEEPVGSLPETGAYAFSADSRHLVYGARATGRLMLLELSTGKLRQLPASPRSVHCLALSPDGQQLALGWPEGARGTVQLRPLDNSQASSVMPLPSAPNDLAWHPAGNRLAAACGDANLYAWDAGAAELVVMRGHKNLGLALRFNPAGDLLASNGWEAVLRLWDHRTGRQVFSAIGRSVLRFSPDGRMPGGLEMHALELAAPREYRNLQSRAAGGQAEHHTPAFHPDGRLLAVGMGGIRLWDTATGAEVVHVGGPEWMGTPSFDARGRLIGFGGHGLLRWPIHTIGPEQLRLGAPEHLFDGTPGNAVDQTPDGRVIALARFDAGAVVLFPDGPPRTVALGPQDDVRMVAVSPDGRLVVTPSFNGRGAGVPVWEAETGRLVTTLDAPDRSVVRFSPDGRWLAVNAQLWEVATWQRVRSWPGVLFFAPDCRLGAIVRDDRTLLVDLVTQQTLAILEDPYQLQGKAAAFSPDGSRLAVTHTESRSIQLWDLHRLRHGLAELRLDWHAAPYAPVVEPASAITPLSVRVDDAD